VVTGATSNVLVLTNAAGYDGTQFQVIVSNAGGMPEVIRDGINGFVVPIRDPESLAARIGQLLGDGHLRSRIGQTGRTIVMDHFNKELMTKNPFLNIK